MVSAPPPVSPHPRSLNFPAIVLAVLLSATAAWLFGPRWPLGRSGEWQIAVNSTTWPASAWELPLAVLGLFGGLAIYFAHDRFKRAVSRRAQSVSTALCVISLSLLAFSWPWALLEPGGASNLINVTWSDVSNEYFGTAYQINDVRAFTRDYVQERQHPTSRTQAHVATHPPGATLFYYGARRIFETAPVIQNIFVALTERLAGAPLATVATEATQVRIAAARGVGNGQMPATLPTEATACALWCAFLLSCAVAATVPAVYLLGASAGSSEGGEDKPEARGLLAATLFALTPSVQLFAFTVDALIACGVAWALVGVTRRMGGGVIWWLAGAGAMLGLTCFVSIGALSGLAIAGLALACRQPRAARVWLQDLLYVGLGFLAIWLLLIVVLPMQPLAILQHALAAHHFATLDYRNRWAWMGLNLVTFAIFSGWALAVAVSGCILINLRGGRRQFLDTIKSRTPGELIGWATLLTMLLLTLSGSVRGEVERLWLFLLPPLCSLAAAAFCPASEEGATAPRGLGSWHLFLIAQALQTVLMSVAFEPLSRPF